MHHQHLLPALFLGLTLVACAQKKDAITADPAPVGNVQNTGTPELQTPRFGGAAKADSLFFSLERTPCFGQCKAYRINVYRSGYATFEGRANVELEGMHRGRVGTDTLETLLREAERIKFFDLNDRYDSPVTDLPSSIIRVVGMGKDKKVVGRVGTPAAFTAFFTKAEELLFPLPWRPIPTPE